MKKQRSALSTSQIIMLGFFLTILAGSFLLALPISSATGKAIPYIDALFAATTATCVTGLVTVPTVTAWSLFGQIVILLLIQVGGLGVITIMSGLMIALQRKLGLSDRLLIQDAFNLNSLSGLVRFVKKAIFGTLVVEGGGALLYMIVFVPEYGLKGIWISIFNAVSAFCNAGIDIIAVDSLCQYVANPLINLVTALLIILGGLGYIVWWDVIACFKNCKKLGPMAFRRLTLHTKIVLSTTGLLILLGTVGILVFEYHNPATMRDYSFFEKLQASFFQSVTTRTAGFATIPQENLSTPSAIISLLLMFIGGSPAGTAGGIKTVTIVVLIASAITTIKNRNNPLLFHRQISKQTVNKAIAVFTTSFTIMFLSTVLLSAASNAPGLDVLYETVSAVATVGLTRSLTPSLDLWGKMIIIVTMYLGRIGPISLFIGFTLRKEKENMIKHPVEEISVG